VRYLAFFVFLLALVSPLEVFADPVCPAGSVCVPPEDMAVFVRLLQGQKCRAENPPSFRLDPVTIVVDRDGRVFGSGADPRPYTLAMTWCGYVVEAKGKVDLVVAKDVPAEGGLRFRAKAGVGALMIDLLGKGRGVDAIDAGVLWEGLYYRDLNLNVTTGFRSVGVAVGVDLTKNVGLYVGYALGFDGLRSNPTSGLSVALWLRPRCKGGDGRLSAPEPDLREAQSDPHEQDPIAQADAAPTHRDHRPRRVGSTSAPSLLPMPGDLSPTCVYKDGPWGCYGYR
jgi:hypothetical protein